MPISAAGSKPAVPRRARRTVRTPACLPQGGFTLIELMVVVALIAIATAGASLALRDSADSALERDAQRLAAVLESARAQARASDAPAMATVDSQGFLITGLPDKRERQAWLSAQTLASVAGPIVLGPEPLIPPQQIVLRSSARAQGPAVWVVTNGLQPFAVQRQAPDLRP